MVGDCEELEEVILLYISTQKIIFKWSNTFDSRRILGDIWEPECTDTISHRSDERLRPLDLSLMDIFCDSVEPVFVMVFFYEKELELPSREHAVSRR